MGAVDRLVAKMHPGEVVSFAQIWIPPHPSTYLGKPTRVDGHWREMGSLQSEERLAVDKDSMASRAEALAVATVKRGGSTLDGGWHWQRSSSYGDKDHGVGGATFVGTSKRAFIQPSPSGGYSVVIGKRNGKTTVLTADSVPSAMSLAEREVRSLTDKLKGRKARKWAPSQETSNAIATGLH